MGLQHALVVSIAVLTAQHASATLNKNDAGGVDGGGARSIVCPRDDRSIRSAELLDLYEGRILHDWQPLEDQRPHMEQLVSAAERINQGRPAQFEEEFESELAHVLSSLQFIKETTLKPVDDSHETIKAPEGCMIAQVANYLPSGRILIDQNIWDSFSETSKAALLIHETVYSIFRAAGETNSVRARRLVSLTFAGQTLLPGAGRELPRPYITCRSYAKPSNQTLIYIYAKEDGAIVAQLDQVDGRLIFGKTEVPLTKAAAGMSVHDALKKRARGPDSSMGAGIYKMSPIDMELGMKVLLKGATGNRFDLFAKAASRSEMRGGNVRFKANDQLTCVPSNTEEIDHDWWLNEFVIRTPNFGSQLSSH